MELHEVTKCPLCGKSEYEFHSQWAFPSFDKAGDLFGIGYITYVRCVCGMEFQNRYMDVEQFEAFYEKDYHKNKIYGNEFVNRAIVDDEEKRSKEYIKYLSEKVPSIIDALDVGSSTGGFLKLLKIKYQCNVTGIEPAKEFADYSNLIGVRTLHKLEELEPNEKFDFISILRTLEHFPQPLDVLSEAHDRLKHNGYLFLDVIGDNYRFTHPVNFNDKTLLAALVYSEFVLRDTEIEVNGDGSKSIRMIAKKG